MIRKIINSLQDFFGISKKEARAALVLMVLSLFLIWTPFVFKRWILPGFSDYGQQVNIPVPDSIARQLGAAGKDDYPRKKDDYRVAEKEPVKAVLRFDFDPNSASIEQLTSLGIPPFLAKRIEKYRLKGGTFRKKEDLLHIYDFPAELYKQLEKHIALPAKTQFTSKNHKAFKPYGSTNDRSDESRNAIRPVMTAFDINRADTTTLIRLQGIGSKLSLRIIKFRDGLGGFYTEGQFSEIFGLDSLARSELTRYARVLSPVRKIHVNVVSADELSKHSYFRNRKMAGILINYRNQHGPFHSMDDLRKVKVLDEATLQKMEPYLSF